MPTMTSPAASSRSCNIDHLLKSLAGNRVAAERLVQMFLDMYPGKIELIDAALQAADWIALRRAVHDLRGSCALFSATPCLALAGKLEDALPDHIDRNLLDDCARFKEAVADVAKELHLFLDDRPRSCQ